MPTAKHHSDQAGPATTSSVAYRQRVSPFYRFAYRISQPIVRWVYRLQAEGLEHVPRTGGVVIAANHVSNLDPWPLGVAVWPRQLHFMAKQELWKPGLRTLLRWTGGFPVRRGEPDREAFSTAVRLCKAGRALGMFPEGTRRSKGLRKTRQPGLHPGTARIALAAGVPMIPAGIMGMDRLSRLGPLRVRFGPPIAVDDLAGLDRRTAAERATERLWGEIQRLEAELASEA